VTAADLVRAGSNNATILIVDDAPENLVVLGEVLSPHYRVRAATSGPAALKIALSEPQPDLILLDIMMPGMDGYAVMERLQADPMTRDIPVVFITAMTGIDDETKGLELGAADYITKPIKPPVVLARVRTQLELKQARDWLQDKNTVLEAEVARRTAETRIVQDVAIRALGRLAEIRDPETGAHLLRTQGYVGILADHLSRHPRYREILTPYQIDLIVRSAPLHDIGKVGIPDAILLKPGKLTPEERAIMQTHTTLGSAALETVQAGTEVRVDFLSTARDIVRWHHEKWDGTGYPDGLAGDAIPLSARLMAVADVFDALYTRRVYKAAMPFDQVLKIIADERGHHFDPDMVDAFFADQARFIETAQRYADVQEATG
jgi:putative two-component system response regulator